MQGRSEAGRAGRSRRSPAQRPLFFRPPIGHTNPIIARVADALDLASSAGASARATGSRGRPRAIVNRVRRGLRDGAIVLMHDASERGHMYPPG